MSTLLCRVCYRWGLGWLKAYKAVGDERYLQRAEIIFNDIAVRAWDTNSCLGGVAWAFNNRYKNAITNELFLSLAAELALTTGKASYVGWARQVMRRCRPMTR